MVFTHGSDGGGKVGSKTIDYGGVRNVLVALGKNKARIALMTAIGVTNRTGSYNRETESHDWKRRAERLVGEAGPRTPSSALAGSTTTSQTNTS